ncbi:hypothetical protein PR001_g14482 [Phytophthora rubi]|uniref:Integrase catalytic domain-containing protein n=1 Tax=Phytophthora rubi TaxID=129364 RepID=A0A6A3LLV2_9STRA|nr:hypothetical protein PR001_g14482 [Phytophthora rubi]
MNGKRVRWLETDGMKLSLNKTRGRYRLQAKPAEGRDVSAISRTSSTAARWHLRFAHLNYPALRQMAVNETVVGLEDLSADADRSSGGVGGKCWTCTASKLKRMSYKQTHTRRATEPFQKLMSDMCSIGDLTYDGYRCFQLVMDEASRWVWGFLMKAKEESRPVVVAHLDWLLAQGKRVEVFSTDQGKELVNKKLKSFLRRRGIEFHWTNAYSPEENGLVEKMNGILVARIRSLLTTANMPRVCSRLAFHPSLWPSPFHASASPFLPVSHQWGTTPWRARRPQQLLQTAPVRQGRMPCDSAP